MSGLYRGVSGLALGTGLFRDATGLYGGATGLAAGGEVPTIVLSGSHTLSEDDPIGTIVGALTVVNPPDGDPTGWTFVITSDPDSKFEIEDLTNNLLLETGDALLLETGDLLLLEA